MLPFVFYSHIFLKNYRQFHRLWRVWTQTTSLQLLAMKTLILNYPAVFLPY